MHKLLNRKFLVERMATFVSSWSSSVQSVPPSYVFPPEKRPGDVLIPICKTIPVIDLEQIAGNDRVDVLQQIIRASQEFGLFQVINHGLPEKFMDGTMKVLKEFFDMPAEDKASLYSDDLKRSCKLYASGLNFSEEIIDSQFLTIQTFKAMSSLI